ncbi:ACP S-malonyltransferase [Vagococcus acidifermentans]|uniref:Malonyl CoA-acyl carrier protein transacylase n=1 Tax=Vagococcus acidifermentans TaxID=564710 RepID=A0A430AXY6_9ENTE|nr:ACP S-malonyltransferase [Vagococcus acidifermentans]RSU12908.1 [acyl-carrier-protein] S-malonyltransferase [Vagococcus acidifermentans]
MKTAFVFSGQGAQYTGMGKEFYDTFPVYKELIDKASEVLQLDMPELMFNNQELLNQTEYTQPAILAMSVAASQVVKDELGVTPDATAGLSLGEYTALVESKAISYEEALVLVRKRGRFMTEAVPAGVGAMAAVMGLDRETVESVCRQSSSRGLVTPANYNMPGQIAIAGEKEAVAYAGDQMKAAGAKRVIPLNVSGPFHTSLLQPAADKLADELTRVHFSGMTIPVVTNLTGKVIPDTEAIRPTLIKQVMSPVYWEDCVETLIAMGIDRFIEIGPGKTLSSFIRKINKQAAVQHVEDVKTLDKLRLFLTES